MGEGQAEGQAQVGAPARSGGAGEVDPRVARSRRVILRAALAELGAVGYGAFTIESVAARAGVGKSTIYRHWPGTPGTPAKLALIAGAFQGLNVQPAPPEAGGAPRERIAQRPRAVRFEELRRLLEAYGWALAAGPNQRQPPHLRARRGGADGAPPPPARVARLRAAGARGV